VDDREQRDLQELTADLPIGGQAVIEGVMMRVPGRIVTAVRAADRRIVVQEEAYLPLGKRYRWLGLPVLRGAVAFFEMMVIGIRALNFSADVAMRTSEGETAGPAAAPVRGGWKDRVALAGTMALALGLGLVLFFFLPLLVAQLAAVGRDALRFNLIAGLTRGSFLLLYLWGISHWREVRRVFQYHGAEHKSIFAREAGAPLSVAQARQYARLHPRCGTSFMLIVVLIAILVFAVVDTLFPMVFGHPQSLLERFATHVCVLPLIGGIGFELLKLSGKKRNHPLTRILIAPGLWLQRITTREPDDEQLEVALVALRRALGEAAEEQAAANAPVSRISQA
jgi:uncharacterized protein YqhQ